MLTFLTTSHAMPYICTDRYRLVKKNWSGFHKISHKYISHNCILKAETISSLQLQYCKKRKRKGTLIWLQLPFQKTYKTDLIITLVVCQESALSTGTISNSDPGSLRIYILRTTGLRDKYSKLSLVGLRLSWQCEDFVLESDGKYLWRHDSHQTK